jgi:hypothetical protein
MLYCDKSEQVTQWSSEELHIPYTSPKDNRTHNYYPDFLIHTVDNRTIMVEIKPKYQWRWDINQSKWKAAKDYCSQNNIEFKVMGQNELF